MVTFVTKFFNQPSKQRQHRSCCHCCCCCCPALHGLAAGARDADGCEQTSASRRHKPMAFDKHTVRHLYVQHCLVLCAALLTTIYCPGAVVCHTHSMHLCDTWRLSALVCAPKGECQPSHEGPEEKEAGHDMEALPRIKAAQTCRNTFTHNIGTTRQRPMSQPPTPA